MIVYNMLMSRLKSEIRLNIKLRINDDKKNIVELWIILKTKYRVYINNFRLKLSYKLSSILMNIYNNNI